jgi:hypothetical protein
LFESALEDASRATLESLASPADGLAPPDVAEKEAALRGLEEATVAENMAWLARSDAGSAGNPYWYVSARMRVALFMARSLDRRLAERSHQMAKQALEDQWGRLDEAQRGSLRKNLSDVESVGGFPSGSSRAPRR